MDRGGRGEVKCRAAGAPDVEFKWFREGREISGDSLPGGRTSTKYQIEDQNLSPLTRQSTLSVTGVEMQDYGPYECRASNIWGSDSHQIVLSVTSKPDPPTRLEVLSTTYNSVILSWQPGFDGGFHQYYRLRWQTGDTTGFQFVDVYPHDSTEYEVTDLMMDTQYSFSIMAFNKLGESGFSLEPVGARTASKFHVYWSRGAENSQNSSLTFNSIEPI